MKVGRWCVRGLAGSLLLGVMGCQSLHGKPSSTADLDQALNTPAAPHKPPEQTMPTEPQPGFDQEPPKSQAP